MASFLSSVCTKELGSIGPPIIPPWPCAGLAAAGGAAVAAVAGGVACRRNVVEEGRGGRKASVLIEGGVGGREKGREGR